MTAKEIRIKYYGKTDSRAYDEDEIELMIKFAKEYHKEQLRIGGVVKSFYCGVVKRKEGEICEQQCAKCEWVEMKEKQ